jgi:hypothetical protein
LARARSGIRSIAPALSLTSAEMIGEVPRRLVEPSLGRLQADG